MLIVYCSNCLSILEERGEEFSYFYESLCETFVLMNYQPADISIDFFVQENLFSIFKFLEENEFVISADASLSTIKIKPTYCKRNAFSHFFAAKGCDHE